MARTVEQIQGVMLGDISANENLAGLNSTSKVSIFRLITYIAAFSIWLFEKLLDTHTVEINNKLANQKAGTLPWYRTKALNFQYGFDLIQDTDVFDNTGATAEAIENSKIIKYSAVNEAQDSSRVILKIAGETGGVLTDFDDPAQVEAIEAYINEIRVAGVQVTIINYKADRLFLNLQIKRDPLVLNDQGMSKQDGNYPVVEALQEFMKELDFNGELRLSALVDKLQLVPGVKDATVLSASTAWIDPALNGYGVAQPINISKIAESGYFEIVTFDNISYVA